MTAWDNLPLRTRREVADHVERCISTFRTDDVEDVIRWAVDGLLASRSFHHQRSYDEGYEDGVQGEAAKARAS